MWDGVCLARISTRWRQAFGLHNGFAMNLNSLSEAAVEHELQMIFRLWDATEEETNSFRSWAHALAAACDGDREVAGELRREKRSLHANLAEEAIRRGTISLELASRRFFVEWLATAVQTQRAA